MKKFMLSLLVMFTLIGCIGSTSRAYEIDDDISITNITGNSAYVDWSGVQSRLESWDGYGITYDIFLGDVCVLEKTTQTSVQLTNIAPNTMHFLYIYASYYAYDEATTYYTFDVFETGSGDGLNGGPGDTGSTVTPSEPTTPEPSYPSEPTTPEPTYPSEPTPSYPSEPAPSAPATTVTLSTPSVDTVEIVDGTVYVRAKNIDPYAERLEWEIYDKKTGKLVKSATSYTVGDTIYGVNGRKVYYARCRVVGHDGNYNDVYSEWSGKKYFVTQPKITSTKKHIKVSSINIKWKKVTGAKNYTVYAKKENSKKWVKVKTTSKTSYELTKIKGKKLNLRNSDYNFRVITNAKVNGKTIKSSNKEYYTAYVY